LGFLLGYLFGPSVLFSDLLFFLWGEIVLDSESLSDFFSRFPCFLIAPLKTPDTATKKSHFPKVCATFDETGHLGTRQLQKGLDVQVVGCENQIQKILQFFDVNVAGIPFRDSVFH
jgi:hypothetical protein